MGELMAQQTFPRTRQTGEEDEPLCTGQPLQVGIEPWVCRCDEVTGRAMDVHSVSLLPLPLGEGRGEGLQALDENPGGPHPR